VTSRTNYHHGALRETLLTATLELIDKEGIGAVSLRRVARAAGVSPGAPYHHFADRAALLTALSDEGFHHLTKTLTEARARAKTPNEALEEILTAYVTFAKDNPAYFHLMFRPELKKSPKYKDQKEQKESKEHKASNEEEQHQEPKDAGDEAFAVLDDTVKTCLAENTVKPVDKDILAITLWSLAHGLASLWLDGQLTHHTPNPETLTQQVGALITTFTTP
jgi:AcrR family transcriptional regulator